MKAQHKKSRLLLFFFVPVLVLSTFVFLPSNNVSAAQYKDLNLEGKARSYTYYRAMVSCVGGIKNEIKADAAYDGLRTDPANGYWFGTGDAKNPDRKGDWWSGDAKNEAEVTPKSTNSSGMLGCSAITKTALKEYWNDVSPADFLKALNYKWNGSDKWIYQGDNGKNKEQRLKDFLSKQGVSTEYTPETEYFVNYNSFINSKACNAKDNGLLSSQSQSIQNRYKEFNQAYSAYEGKTVYKSVNVATETKPEQHGFTYTGNTDLPNGLSGAYPLYYDNYKTCDEMAANISKTAAQYTLSGQKEACSKKGYAGAFLSACVDGMANKGTVDYCNKYSNAQSKTACTDGAALAVAGGVPSPVQLGDDPDANAPDASSCVIEGVGWIICPVVKFLANIADGAFGFLADTFLRTDPSAFKDEGPAHDAWIIMRNVANVLFVIAFLFIIFSQLTGAGISNYGVKKMLPRLVIAAILVNVSFLISQLAVDLSNILGYSIRDVFDGVSKQVRGATYADVTSAAATGNSFTDIAVGILAFSGAIVALYALLSTFGAVILAAVIALLMILFILIARQVIVILLVVLSPIAFVALLLPNTEGFFKFWRKTLTAMLLLFPIIALVFGASSLASTVLQGSFTGAYSQEGSNWFGQIVASAILVLPLFVVPVLLKKSLDGIPMIGQVASKWANRSTGGLSNKVRDSYKGSKIARGAAIRKQAREVYKGRKFAKGLTEGRLRGVNQVLASGIPITGAERAGNAALKKSAASAMIRADQEEVEDAKRLIESGNLSGAQRQMLAMNKKLVDKDGKQIKGYSGAVVQKAAIQMQLGGAGSINDVHEIVEASGRDKDGNAGKLSAFGQTISQGALSSTGKDPTLGGVSIDEISQGTFNYEAAAIRAAAKGKYTAEAFAGMDNSARTKVIGVAEKQAAAGDSSMLHSLQDAARGIQGSTDLTGRISGNVEAQDQVAKLLGGSIATPVGQAQAQAAAAAQTGAGTATQAQPSNPSPTVQRARETAEQAAQGTTGDRVFAAGRTAEDGVTLQVHEPTPTRPQPAPAQPGVPAGQARTTTNAQGQSVVQGQHEDTIDRMSR